jgi:tetratricopeptide (TPR) repeat protein
VEANRQRGLQELWQAATTPGLQQFEGMFFLVEVLCGVEDDAIEALPLALRLHARYPRGLPAALSLATVHLAMERPDLAVDVLAPLAGEGLPRSTAARFFIARTLCVSGLVVEALELLDGFAPEELASMTWLQGWHAYYRGLAYEQLGRVDEARRAFESACEAPEVAESHRYARRALDRSGNALDRSVRAAEASLSWNRDATVARRELRSCLQQERDGSAMGQRRGRLALALMAFDRGEPERAVEMLLPLVRDDEGDEAWLVVRPRVRLLQALWCSGRWQEARTWASRFAPLLGDWGSNRQLELLVQTCSQTEPPPCESEAGGMPHFGNFPTRFIFKDTGFSRVGLEILVGERTHTIPMHLHERFWQVEIALGQGAHLYRFNLECLQTFPDPAAAEFLEREDGMWSVCTIEAGTGSLETQGEAH